MIFYEQDTQWFGCFARDTIVPTSFRGSCWQGVECHFESGAKTSATALPLNCAMMEIDKTFGNRQPEAESAELSSDRRIGLFEWLEQRSQPLRFNANPGIGNFEMKTSSLVVKGANGDQPTFGGEFHGVVHQVPKHLLKPDAISQDAIFFRLKLG